MNIYIVFSHSQFFSSKSIMHLLYIKAKKLHETHHRKPKINRVRLSKCPKVSDDARTLSSNTESMAFNDHVMYDAVEYRTALYRLFVFLFLALQ